MEIEGEKETLTAIVLLGLNESRQISLVDVIKVKACFGNNCVQMKTTNGRFSVTDFSLREQIKNLILSNR